MIAEIFHLAIGEEYRPLSNCEEWPPPQLISSSRNFLIETFRQISVPQ